MVNRKKSIKGLHLSYDERLYIEHSLDAGMSFKEIGNALGRHPTTISKEVRKHQIELSPRIFNNEYVTNRCLYRYDCHLMNVCASLYCTRKQCKTCGKCNAHCKKFVLDECHQKEKPPYVCNGCRRLKTTCQFGRKVYKANTAHQDYLEILKESREGINMTKAQLAELDELISPLILKGQPISHIYVKHKDEIPCSIRTIYTYVEKQYFTVRNIDLRRKVRYKVRNHRRPTEATRLAAKFGRRYRDFIRYVEDYDPAIVEMDTVMGGKGETKCLLTLYFRRYRLMWAFLLNDKAGSNVLETFDFIEHKIGTDLFKKYFPVILTDNSSEFLKPHSLERSLKGGKRTLIFYCDPNCAFQKGGIERNHEYIRYVIPKGVSFNTFNQEDINLLISHINSVARDSLDGACPFEAAPEELKKASKKLRFNFISPDEINLTAFLLFS